jgi:dCMP deaminase
MKGGRVYGEKWDRRFLELAKTVSTWSKDPSTKVGAVLVAPDKRVVGLGYNGFPKGVDDDERLDIREIKYEIVVHAEVNAIIQAGHAARGSTLYCYPSFQLPPICARCAGVAIQAGVRGIVGYKPDPNDERNMRWTESISIAENMWDETHLVVLSYEEETEVSPPSHSLLRAVEHLRP